MRAGSRHSAESKARMAAAKLGRRLSPETIAKRSAASIGQRRGPEARERMRLGHWSRGAQAAAIRAAMRGNRNNQEAPVKGECVYCGAPAQTFDHLLPSKRGGVETVPSCRSCNSSKGARTPEEWLEEGLYSR